MRILVTGATGFIGKPLIPLLKQNSFFIRTTNREIDNNIFPKDSSLNDTVFFDLSTDKNDYNVILEDIDVVIHLAAKVHNVSSSRENSEEYFKINAGSTEKLAKLASLHGVKRFIFLSSIKVNGERNISDEKGNILAFNEGDDPRPQGAYAKSKLEAEDVIRKICNESKMDFVILRPTLVYGTGVKANFLSLLNIINKNYPLPFASIKNKRSLLYVSNLAHAIFTCIERSEAANKTYLISDVDISVPELIKKIAYHMEKNTMLFHCPVALLKLLAGMVGKQSMISRITDSLLVDSSRFRRELNWTPPYSLDEGIRETVSWYCNRE